LLDRHAGISAGGELEMTMMRWGMPLPTGA
jgi:hypothetical protein